MVKTKRVLKNLTLALIVVSLAAFVFCFYGGSEEIYAALDSRVKTGNERDYVAISGELYGLRLFKDGVVVVGIGEFKSIGRETSPAKEAGLRKGDVIYKVDGVKITSCSQLTAIFGSAGEKSMNLQFIRNGEHFTVPFSLAYSDTEGKYKAGIWIRDSAAGIGTMTFFDPITGGFACLGHGVCDIDTGELLPVLEGDIVRAKVNGCYKGTSGKAGELCGVFSSETKGRLLANNKNGVYGTTNENFEKNSLYPVAEKSEVKKGRAEIIATVDENGPESFDIEITKISKDNRQGKNMVIKIIDDELIEKTGGIVQGMSGSPIIQEGMLIGAVTHVFINDPTGGYAIFSQTMLKNLRKVQKAS